MFQLTTGGPSKNTLCNSNEHLVLLLLVCLPSFSYFFVKGIQFILLVWHCLVLYNVLFTYLFAIGSQPHMYYTADCLRILQKLSGFTMKLRNKIEINILKNYSRIFLLLTNTLAKQIFIRKLG